MKYVKLLFILAILNIGNTNAQSRIEVLKSHEEGLLNLLLADSINDVNFNIPTKKFNFGLEEPLFGNFNIIKKKREILLQPIGTGRLYQVRKENSRISLNRIDKTVHSGTNFYAHNFVNNDTIYQYGGIGFWQMRGILTQYSTITNQWELIKSDREVKSYFVDNNDAVIHFDNGTNPMLYVSNSYFLKHFPKQYEIESIDSVFSYDINKHQWNTLGKLNPLLKKILSDRKNRELEINYSNYYIAHNGLDFYWIDFKNNKFGNIKAEESKKLRYKWLSFYNNEKKSQNEDAFQFLMGDNIYLIKVSDNNKFLVDSIKINFNWIDLTITNPIYLESTDLFSNFYDILNWLKEQLPWILIILMITAIAVFFLRNKKKLPKEVVSILNKNFFNSLTIVEKELIEELYNHHLKGEEVSTKLINKIIGVQQKDTLTQNKSRSDYFIRINQKFKMATQYTEPLIVKQRDHSDKRQYNYSLNSTYIVDIEKLFKE